MWIGATYYDGQLPLKAPDETWGDFGQHLVRLVYEGAYPTAKAWTVYWTFFVFEALMSVLSLPPILASVFPRSSLFTVTVNIH